MQDMNRTLFHGIHKIKYVLEVVDKGIKSQSMKTHIWVGDNVTYERTVA